MNLSIDKHYFGELIPFVEDEKITDITWNGSDLWLDDLEKGRYKSDIKLSDQFVKVFSTRIANLANKNFNMSEPLLEAETDGLRISIIDNSVTNTDISIAIRKTPAVRRLDEKTMISQGYAEALVIKLLEAFVKGHASIIVTGDVGSGKTELVKYLTKFIPSHERTISIEDNYELRLSSICPDLDCVEMKASLDGQFSYQTAIKAALRQLCKWLLMAEARSKEVIQLLEAASTGCIVMTTMHSDDVRKIPDRVVNMMGADGEEKRNDVYNFFDVCIKVNIEKTSEGIRRNIDQICVLDRENEENNLYLIYNKGFTGQTLPKNLWQKLEMGAKKEIGLFSFLMPSDAHDRGNIIDTPEFAKELEDLEKEVLEEFKDPLDDLKLANDEDLENAIPIEDLIPKEEPVEEVPEPEKTTDEVMTSEEITDEVMIEGGFDCEEPDSSVISDEEFICQPEDESSTPAPDSEIKPGSRISFDLDFNDPEAKEFLEALMAIRSGRKISFVNDEDIVSPESDNTDASEKPDEEQVKVNSENEKLQEADEAEPEIPEPNLSDCVKESPDIKEESEEEREQDICRESEETYESKSADSEESRTLKEPDDKTVKLEVPKEETDKKESEMNEEDRYITEDAEDYVCLNNDFSDIYLNLEDTSFTGLGKKDTSKTPVDEAEDLSGKMKHAAKEESVSVNGDITDTSKESEKTSSKQKQSSKKKKNSSKKNDEMLLEDEISKVISELEEEMSKSFDSKNEELESLKKQVALAEQLNGSKSSDINQEHK